MDQLRKSQEAAFQEIAKIEEANQPAKKGISKMRSTTKQLLSELKEIKHWHDLELSELESKKSD